MDHLHLGPMLVLHQAVKLASAIRADGHDECTTPDLLCQTDELHLVEFLRAVDGEAPRRPAQRMHQHRDFGRIGAEMRMQMLDACRAQPGLDAAGLGQIDEVHGQRTVRATAHAPRQRQCLHAAHRPGEQHAHQGKQQGWRAFAQDIARAFALELVFRVHQLGVPAAQRNSHDLEPVPFERQDFAPDEAVADCWVLVDQVGNAHDDITCIR